MKEAYSIEKREDAVYVKLDANATKKQRLGEFASDISDILSRNRGQPVILDTSDFPEGGTPNNSDWSKSRYTVLIRFMSENPNLSVRASQEVFELYKPMLNGIMQGTADRFYLNPKKRVA